jgi:nucleotide sugar dehydrogenase
MTKYNLGIIGNGFVGSATVAGFSLHANVRVYDENPKASIDSFEETINESEFVFVCVPTPMSLETGKIDLSIIESVFDRVSKVNKRDDNIFIIKSTVIPGSVEKLVESYPGLNIVFSPEFLTERNAKLDFINAARIIIGGRDELVNRVELMFRDRFPHTPIIKTDVTTAQFIKYMSNCFFATKVAFMNEMKQAADVTGVDWRTAVNGFLLDGRIGNSHIDVPGHDGMMGFGGKCFPKDINAFINYFDEIGIDAKIMKAAWDKNIEVRSKHDWLDIKGAVTRKS